MSNTYLNDDQNDPDASNESTRLLLGNDEEAVRKKQTATPLPKAQLGALMAVRFVDPVACQQIFPYINQLLVDMRVAVPERVGFYSGLVESAYLLAQVLSVYHCGRISDIVGRRPVILTGLVGTILASTAFGLSTSFAGIVASRFFGGLIAGNVAVLHSVLAEITDETNQDLAMPVYSIAWNLGTVIGPLLGGALENAATRYPKYFNWHIFVEHPYLPPCIATAACALVAVVLGYFLIEETLQSKRKYTQSSAGPHTNTDPNETGSTSALELLSIPAMRALTISGFALSFLTLSFDVVFALFCYTPVGSGGMGLEPSTIGNTLASAGLLSIFLRLPALPYILRRFDYAKTYNVCMYAWPFAFGLLPFLNLMARAHPPSSWTSPSTPPAFLWVGLLTPLVFSKIAITASCVSVLLVKQHAPSPSLLGRSNGIVNFAMCIGRAVAPLFVSTLFTCVNGMAWAKRWGLGGLWAVVMVVSAIAGARVTRRLASQ